MPFAVGKRSYSDRSSWPSCAGRRQRTPRPSLPGRSPRCGGSGRQRRDRRSAEWWAPGPLLGRPDVRRTDVGRAPSRARGHRRRGPARPASSPRPGRVTSRPSRARIGPARGGDPAINVPPDFRGYSLPPLDCSRWARGVLVRPFTSTRRKRESPCSTRNQL